MNATIILEVLLFVTVGLFGAFVTFIALKTLFGRRPLLISGRWLFVFTCLFYLGLICNSISEKFSSPAGCSIVEWISPLLYIVFPIFAWIARKEYTVLAVSNNYFREALLSAANDLGISIEETASSLKIKETGQEMHFTIQGDFGTANLKPIGKKSDELVREIATSMTKYFQETSGKMIYMASCTSLILGLTLIAMSAWMVTLYTNER